GAAGGFPRPAPPTVLLRLALAAVRFPAGTHARDRGPVGCESRWRHWGRCHRQAAEQWKTSPYHVYIGCSRVGWYCPLWGHGGVAASAWPSKVEEIFGKSYSNRARNAEHRANSSWLARR